MDVVNFAHAELFIAWAPTWAWSVLSSRPLTRGNFWARSHPLQADQSAHRARRSGDDRSPLIRRRSSDHYPGHVSTVLVAANLRACGSSARRAQDSRSPSPGTSTLFYLRVTLWYRLVIAGLFGRQSSLVLALPQITAPTAHGFAPQQQTVSWPRPWAIPVLVHTLVFAIAPGWPPPARVFARWSASTMPMGPRPGSSRPSIVRRGRRHGDLGGSIAASSFTASWNPTLDLVSRPQAVIVSFVVLVLTLLFRPTACSFRRRRR